MISLFTWVIFAPYVKVKVVIWSNAMLSCLICHPPAWWPGAGWNHEAAGGMRSNTVANLITLVLVLLD